MKKTRVTVVDYGVGNILSVQRSLERCGAEVILTSCPEEVLVAEKVVLPGVGAFSSAMQSLQERGLVEAVRSVAQSGTPLLGICLGMQLLLDESEEFGLTRGIGLIPGRVVPLPMTTKTGKPLKIPHIGWTELVLADSKNDWTGSLLRANRSGEAAYFLHSFMATPTDSQHRLADCFFGDHKISAAISCGRITGCQFHPEKSGAVGLKILQHFCFD